VAGRRIRDHGPVTKVGPWLVRGAWFVLPLLAGPALADALDGASSPVQLTAAVLLWGGWTAGMVATLVPRAVSLTAIRLAAPAAAVAITAAAVHGPAGGDDAVALAAAVVVLAAAWSGVTTDAFVDGSSYGDERRFALRSPLTLLAAAAVAWVLAVAAPGVGLLLLAAKAWLPGALLLAVGAVGVGLGVPALHRLSRRWLVLVPAGLVVHDHVALPDPVLLRRATLRAIRPAAETDADDPATLDASLGAPGLVLTLELVEPTDLPVAEGTGRHRRVATVVAERMLVTLVRPGAFLAAAAPRLPVG
jgi:hypothetical protein